MPATAEVSILVRVQPADCDLSVSIPSDASAASVISFCQQTLQLGGEYQLVGDFNGYVKRFEPGERLYQLIRKRILCAQRDQSVKFFVQKRKQTNFPTLAQASASEDYTTHRVYDDDDDLLSLCSNQSVMTLPMLDATPAPNMSFAELCQLADRQKAHIARNNSSIAQRESHLRAAKHNEATATHKALTERLRVLRDRVKSEEAEMAKAKQLRGNVDVQRTIYDATDTELTTACNLLASKERQLAEAAARVDELRRKLAEAKHQTSNSQVTASATTLEQDRLKFGLEAARTVVASDKERLATSNSRLTQRRDELQTIDRKVDDLVDRLQRWREPIADSPANRLRPTRPKAAIEPFNVTKDKKTGVSGEVSPKPAAKNDPEASTPESGSMIVAAGEDLTVRSAQAQLSQTVLQSRGYTTAFSAMQEVLEKQTGPSTSNAPIAGDFSSLGRASPYSKFLNMNASTNVLAPRPYKPAVSGSADPYSTPPSTSKSRAAASTGPAWSGDRDSMSSSESNESVNSGDVHGKRSKVRVSINRRIQMPSAEALYEDAPPPDLIPADEWHSQRLQRSAAASRDEPPSASTSANGANATLGDKAVDEFYSHVEPDKLHLRSDNMRAVKRRSWAEHHGATSSETDHIRRLLKQEQLKGRHINLSWVFHEVPPLPKVEIQPAPATPEVAAASSAVADLHPPLVPVPSENDAAPANVKTDNESRPATPDSLDLVPVPTNLADLPTPPLDEMVLIKQPPSYDDLLISRVQVEQTEPVPEVISTEPPVQTKGILKNVNSLKKGVRICFNPLALLLDAALEGELELVKKSAHQLNTVSVSNDEGITALHNAICAGHYEIVRFLIEAEADVNAPDSDGWTPLHCAASCNNLPMVKFLVEHGACVFATTLSDHETPADKCEEDEDGYDGCSQFLIAIQEKLGVMNGAKAYAAYNYEAQEEDELTFSEATEFLIIKRDDGPEAQKGWWWARRVSDGKEGYVPRNYLALYPRIGLQRNPLTLSDTSNMSSSKLNSSGMLIKEDNKTLVEVM